jgi:hypothetical protein
MFPAHSLVTGTTGSGKSYFALNQARSEGWGQILFWNPQEDELADSWPQADWRDRLDLLFRSGHVSYVPQRNPKHAAKEARALVDYAMQRVWTKPVLFIWDECDLLAPQGRQGTPLHEVAQRGRKRRVFGRNVTQFPALVDKTIVRQCRLQYYFPTPFGDAYYRRQGLDPVAITGPLERSGMKFPYMRWTNGKLEGPFQFGMRR